MVRWPSAAGGWAFRFLYPDPTLWTSTKAKGRPVGRPFNNSNQRIRSINLPIRSLLYVRIPARVFRPQAVVFLGFPGTGAKVPPQPEHHRNDEPEPFQTRHGIDGASTLR